MIMSDSDLVAAKEIARIHNHLKAAAKWLKKLEARSGRRLTIFCETGEPYLIDEALDGASERTGQSRLLDQGGIVVARLNTNSQKFDGGGW